MGDMKTPDFDDLLAAFDIPDATSLDGKEAIHPSHDEAEGHLKPAGMCMDDGIPGHHSVPALDIPAVSVIVKNTSRQESFEASTEKEAVRQGHLVPNGFRSGGAAALDFHHLGPSSYGKLETSFLNGDSSRGPPESLATLRPDRMPSFSQFSPISSPETEDAQGNGVEVRPKQDERPYFPAASSLFEPVELDSQRKLIAFSMFDNCHKRDVANEPPNSLERPGVSSRPEQTRTEERSEGLSRDHAKRHVFLSSQALSLEDLHGTSIEEKSIFPMSEAGLGVSHQAVRTPASKLSSCLAALAALNAKKDAEASKETKAKPTEPSVSVKEAPKASPLVPKSPKSPRSPLESVKRFLKQPDSPMSACSDSSGKASPSVTTGSPPAIPRVRIKTIKTSSGQIKRTVTSVLPDSELEDLLSPAGSTPSHYTASAEEMSPSPLPTPPPRSLVADYVFENGKSKPPSQTMPAVTMMTPASLPSKVNSVRAEGGFRKKARGQSSSTFQNASSALMRAVNVVQQQQHRHQKAVSVQLANVPNTSFLPKAVHLANLNLVPHSVAASVTARSGTPRQNQPQLSSPTVCSTVPLVHQVKNTTPLPCTALPSQAVDTLNRLLNATNPVPTYVPNLNPPPECDIGLPARGYRCLECGDSFGLEKSLAQHYGRRSVHIEVACMHCSKTLVFLNKCSLLAHAREHKSQGMVMQCTQLFMKPIPADQMFGPPPGGSTAPTAAAPRVSPSASASGSPAPASSTKVKPVMPLYPDKIIRHGLKCLECNKQLADYRSLAGHYQRVSEETEGLTCKLCPMLLPNKCSYRAHQRLHAHKSPYCCPECGAVSRSVDIQKHVKENCLHYARKIGHRCLHCEMFYMSTNVHKRHIEEKHCEVFYKCSLCPVAFKSADGCLMHIKNKHNASNLSPQLIYKCACETVFKKKQLLFQHFHQSAKKHCVFKCPECNVVFTQKQPLMQHFKSVHGGAVRAAADGERAKRTEDAPPPPPPPRQEASAAPPRQASANVSKPAAAASQRDGPAALKSNSKMNLKNAGWTCGECLHWLPDRETYVSHMKTNHGKSVKRYPCQQCERSFNSSTSLRRHLRNDHMGKKKVYTCWYCTDQKTTFTKHFMLKNHISLMHGIKNPDFSQMANPLQGPSRVPGEEPGAKRKGEEAAREGAGGAALEAAPAKRPKPQFRCAKCGFTTEDSQGFQQHIPQHKADDGTPQCAHCGLCFASRLALSRHLFIVHKVKRLEEEEEEEVEEEEEQEEEEEEEEKEAAEGAVEHERDDEAEGARSPPRAGGNADSTPPAGQASPSVEERGARAGDFGGEAPVGEPCPASGRPS